MRCGKNRMFVVARQDLCGGKEKGIPVATQEIRHIASQRRTDVPMFCGRNSTLAAPFGASMVGFNIIVQRASFWIGPRYPV